MNEFINVCIYGVAGSDVVVNDLIFQAATPYLPFGGVGHSDHDKLSA
jgi:hypothetical protein